MSGKRRGWIVKAPGAKPVGYPSRTRARGVARQVKGASVSSSSCLMTLLLLPILLPLTLVTGLKPPSPRPRPGHHCGVLLLLWPLWPLFIAAHHLRRRLFT